MKEKDLKEYEKKRILIYGQDGLVLVGILEGILSLDNTIILKVNQNEEMIEYPYSKIQYWLEYPNNSRKKGKYEKDYSS